MKVLVTGAKGQLGSDVVAALAARGIEYLGADLEDFDITQQEQTRDFLLSYRPDAVIHCAAYTAVDKAEDEPELCERVNRVGTENIALACREIGAKMLYISTDYVFAGDGDAPYETGDPTGPKSVYGKTKLAGELAVQTILERYFIVRISWVFGENGNNFVKTMLRLGKERDTVRVVNDQIGSPTYTKDLAPLLCEMVASERFGIYHASCEGFCSWAEFAAEIFARSNLDVKVEPIPTEEYPTKATRPMNSRLSKQALVQNGFAPLPDWRDALERFLKNLQK